MDIKLSLNSKEILEKEFRGVPRGYDPLEVDEFLDKILSDAGVASRKELKKIIKPTAPQETTLLSWFASNTSDSCNVAICPEGKTLIVNTDRSSYFCADATQYICGIKCDSDHRITVLDDGTQNCCTTGKDAYGNCCSDNTINPPKADEWWGNEFKQKILKIL